MYRAVLRDYPSSYDAWFNLGVIQSRNGQWQHAIRSFSQAEKAAELRVVAASAKLKLLVDNRKQISDADFPKEFRGENRGSLGVQGPCHNAANELRNRGYTCAVEGEGESCSIVSVAGSAKYIIVVNDLAGMLIKNVFREEHGSSVSLGDVDNLSETDLLFRRLDVGRLPLAQVPISGALDSAAYSRLRSASQRKLGPHGWTREGRSFEEVAARNRADARPGVSLTQVLSIEDVARSNCVPGAFLACVLDGEPRAVAVVHEVREDQLSTIKRTVEGGACIFRGEFFPMPEYPLVHIGLGVPVQYLDDRRVTLAIVENLANFVEANFQDWVAAVEAKKYTLVHVYGPGFSHIVSGRTHFDAETIESIVGAVSKANASFREIPETRLVLKAATARFNQQHPDPFIWSSS
jgi:hypothetical protein